MPTAALDHPAQFRSVPRSDFGDVALSNGISDICRIDSLTLGRCREPAGLFAELVESAASSASVDARALRVRALLQLPRVATFSGRVTRKQIERELWHSARLLRRDTAAAESLVPQQRFGLQELKFAENFDPARASRVFSSLHYLRSARDGSEYFALLDPVQLRPVTICCVAPLEWKKLGSTVRSQFGISPEHVRDVARVYSCTSAPPNAVSYLLARVRNVLARRNQDIDLLLTAVDPNLGFTGSSYRAANWQWWLTVQPRPYLYLDRRYITPRQLRQRFGTSSLDELRASFPRHHFEQSRTRLLASLIFCCHVGRGPVARLEMPGSPLHR